MMHRITRIVLPALLLLLWAGTAWAAAGSVVGLSGDCVVETGGNRNPAKLGQPIEVGDTVEVPAGGKLKLRMGDGSVISVAPGTRVTITTYATNAAGQRQDAQLSLTQGLLRAVVAPVPGPPARFEVDTAVGAAAVRSTDWFVETDGTTMQVNVLAGSVELTSTATKQAVTIPARSGARLEAGHDPAAPARFASAVLSGLITRTAIAAAGVRRAPPPRVRPRPRVREERPDEYPPPDRRPWRRYERDWRDGMGPPGPPPPAYIPPGPLPPQYIPPGRPYGPPPYIPPGRPYGPPNDNGGAGPYRGR